MEPLTSPAVSPVRPERFLGADPTPGDLAETDAVMGALREVVRLLVESRGRVDAQLAADGVWSGPVAEPLSRALGALSRRLLAYEDAVAELARAVDEWRAGFADRTDRTVELVEQMSRLAGDDDSEGLRATVRAAADELARDHESAAATLRRAVDEVAGSLDGRDRLDLADELGHAAAALTVAVEQWVQEQAAEMAATAESLVQVAGLTRVVTELLGVTGLDRAPIEDDDVAAMASRGASAHRLLGALSRAWTDVAPTSLPIATFAVVGGSAGGVLADRVAGRTNADAPGEGGAT